MSKNELIEYLNEYLNITWFKDSSKNWLQVDNSKLDIKKIWYAVDANTYIFEKAKQENIDLILTHHGIFWWYEQTLTGISYERTKILLDNDIWLYSAHLPLDAHPEVWNNIWLAKAFIRIFWLREEDYELENFWDYHGYTIGYWIKFKNKLHVSNLVVPYAEQMQLLKKFYNFWNLTNFNSVCFVSGSALASMHEAKLKWYDVLITWEWVHHEMTLAKEIKQSILIWGHYETEKIGPKLLAYHLKKKFDVDIEFLDEKY
jgi:dinuclear metal center YbgI/SA1388 family protein